MHSARYKLHKGEDEVLIPLSDMHCKDSCVAVPPGDRCYDKSLLKYYLAQKLIV